MEAINCYHELGNTWLKQGHLTYCMEGQKIHLIVCVPTVMNNKGDIKDDLSPISEASINGVD
jgi:hypothetical protein